MVAPCVHACFFGNKMETPISIHPAFADKSEEE